ncbi:MAG: hypothetical protein CL916_02310 [Deltaproteobacteria bacterium]|nr:hypothetical protein [Deltaproteobacteria bacterium]
MPFRKKISRILRRLSSYNQASREVQNTASSPETTKKNPISAHPNQKEAESSKNRSETPTNIEIILYGRPSCPYCARVDRVIEELNIENQIIRRLTTYGSEWREDLRNKTGSTQVPCLFIDGQPMFESLDIIDWIRTNLV